MELVRGCWGSSPQIRGSGDAIAGLIVLLSRLEPVEQHLLPTGDMRMEWVGKGRFRSVQFT